MKTGIGSFSLAAKSSIPSTIFLEFPTPHSHLPWKYSPHYSISKKCRSISYVLGLVKDVKNEGGSNIRKRAIVGVPKDHCQSPLEAVHCIGASHLGWIFPGSWWALKALVKCADRSLVFMSPSREGCRLPASSGGFPEERTCNSRTRHLYKHLTGGLALGQRIFWLFFFFPTRSIIGGKVKT